MGQKIYVSATVVNLAGEEENRVRYLKTTVIGGVLSKNVKSLGEHITRSYITGPGINFEIYGRWVRSKRTPPALNYNDTIQFKTTSVGVSGDNDLSVIAGQLDVEPPKTVEIFSANVDQGLYTYWADQWMLENYPELFRTNWTVTYEQPINTITVTFADNTTESFVPEGNIQSDMYLFVKYRTVLDSASNTLVTGGLVVLNSGEPFPSVTGWTLVNNSTITPTATLTRTSQVFSTYSDNRTPTHSAITTTTSTQSYTQSTLDYERVITQNGTTTNSVIKTRGYYQHIQTAGTPTVTNSSTVTTVGIGGGVTRTDTTVVNQQVFNYLRTTQLSTREIGNITYSNTKLYIYKLGSGNAILDGIIGSSDNAGKFLPFIPVYVDNKFLSKDYLPNIHKAAKTSYRRATKNHQLSKITKRLAKNESLPDIDYTFVVFGVSLNVVEMACKEYLYYFFHHMMLTYGTQSSNFAKWLEDFEIALESQRKYDIWRQAQGNTEDPLDGTPAPTIIPYPKLPETRIRTYSENPVLGYDNSIIWSSIEHESFTGLYKPKAKKGDAWLEIGPVVTRTELVPQEHWEGAAVLVNGEKRDITTTYLYFQDNSGPPESKETYQKLTILNLKHRNVVYKGHFVETTATFALKEPEESRFIVPLHEAIYRDMRLVTSTQMTTTCSFLVFNSYVVKKIRWYQTGFFKVLLIIAAIYISVQTGVDATGILGLNSTVGAAAGFTVGSAAAIAAGATINAIAAMIVFNVLTNVAIKLLGPEMGAILAAVAMIMHQNPGAFDSFGSSLSEGFSQLLRADNMLQLTNAVGSAYQASTQAMAIQAQKDITAYNEKAGNLRKEYFAQFGDKGGIDVSQYLVNQTYSPLMSFESLEDFLTRTLLSGTDVAGLTNSLLTDFADVTLDIQNA